MLPHLLLLAVGAQAIFLPRLRPNASLRLQDEPGYYLRKPAPPLVRGSQAIFSPSSNRVHHHPNSTANCETATKFFQVPIEHGDDSKGTFALQYHYLTDYFKPGGPIFIFQGEESVKFTCVETTIMVDWAKKTGGIAAAVEHRYFGDSLPYGEDSWTPEHLLPLTLDNIMDDTAAFVRLVQETVPGAENSKAIVGSGSYGGFLMTVFRQNRPDDFFAVLAAAGPTRALRNVDHKNEERFEWFKWVERSYRDQSFAAYEKLRDAFEYVTERLAKEDGYEALEKDFDTCEKVTDDTASLLWFNTILGLMVGTELNYPDPDLEGRNPLGYPMNAMIKRVLDAKDHIEVLRAPVMTWLEPLGNDKCYPVQDFSERYLVPLIQRNSFSYCVCTFVPLMSSDIPKGSMFPATDLGHDDHAKQCYDVYGLESIPDGEELLQRYHLTKEELHQSTHIIFSLGGFDPVSAVSVDYMPLTTNVHRSRLLFEQDMAHREDLLSPMPNDRSAVTRLRNIELEIFKEWLASA